ncbi:SDR family NAD(P)-dependent oxidoreductase [Nocardioides marmoriginsengisoli]|uniref:SDR family NAD(P)-dependent oxidoreductase n=1 Tax=Nocardioides marmoriginsengisoli TaxID=661483 RepID=A0A3N0CFV3_9ACTN|nr:SDR family NAD(P)-dependent oxidoreductase [Nocardioides marmoriginsengisoli]RNL62334.1 SDR family NAD(P)-dependent oxidoreductase [Nocardioides marmoriginsengisoli]
MDLSARGLAKAVVKQANSFGAMPISSRGVLNRAVGSLGDSDGSAALRKAVGGKVVLVTGASSGIGRSAAVRLAAAGAQVLLVARSEDQLAEVVDEVAAAGGLAIAYRCDLTDFDQIDALVTKVLDRHGHVDILVNNAGMSIRRKVRHSQDRFQDFERPMHLNYFAAVRLTMGLLPTMVERESGQVINISSWAAMLHPARFSGYTASKAALEAWSDCVQGEVLDDGVVFTNVRMPLVRTPMITPTKLYSRMPALSMEQAATVVCDATVSRSRRVTPLVAAWASFAESVSPALGDLLRKNAI